MNELSIQQDNMPATAQDIRAQVNLIQSVMQDVMQDKVHYGKIPGCGDNPTLLKPGAEKIMATFRLAADPEVTDLSSPDEARFMIKVRLTSSSGLFVGAGIGECSSSEDKYKWRRAVCDEEYDDTPDDRRRAVWKKGWNNKPNYQVKQVRANVADLRNTVLKMAKKRGLVDAVLTATAASDIFTQDIEDLPEEYREGSNQASQAPAGVASMQESNNPTLIKELETIAANGWDALQKKWGSMSDDDRKSVGSEFGRIKKIAEAV